MRRGKKEREMEKGKFWKEKVNESESERETIEVEGWMERG